LPASLALREWKRGPQEILRLSPYRGDRLRLPKEASREGGKGRQWQRALVASALAASGEGTESRAGGWPLKDAPRAPVAEVRRQRIAPPQTNEEESRQ